MVMSRTPPPPEAEPTEPADLPMPPSDVAVYIAPGMQTATFAELLQGAGIMRDQAGVLQELEDRIEDLQRQIDELRGAAAPVEPAPLGETPAPDEAQPEEPPITRPSSPPPSRPPFRRR